MTSHSKQFLLQLEDGEKAGPYHWKRIVEWYELALIEECSVLADNGVAYPVKDLVDAYGVPSTVSVFSIFLARPEKVSVCAPEELVSIYELGFPKVKTPLWPEMVDHIEKRMRLTDEQLDLEDAGFSVDYDAFPPVSEAASKPAPAVVTSEEEKEASASPLDAELEEVVVDDPTPEAAVDSETDTVAQSRPIEEARSEEVPDVFRELLEGDPVESTHDYNEEVDTVESGGKRMPLVLIVVLIAVFGIGGVLYYAFKGDGESNVLVNEPDAPEVLLPATVVEGTDVVETPEATQEAVVFDRIPDTDADIVIESVGETLLEAVDSTNEVVDAVSQTIEETEVSAVEAIVLPKDELEPLEDTSILVESEITAIEEAVLPVVPSDEDAATDLIGLEELPVIGVDPLGNESVDPVVENPITEVSPVVGLSVEKPELLVEEQPASTVQEVVEPVVDIPTAASETQSPVESKASRQDFEAPSEEFPDFIPAF